MARIRSLKPEFWTDEAVAECSPSARLLFVATWTFADDKGNLDRSAKQLKAQAYPYDALDCEPLVQELLGHDLLIEYEVDGKKYLHIRNFEKHQKVDKESKPRFPLYDDSKTTPRVLAEPSPSPRPSSLVSSSLGVESSREETKGGERGGAAGAAVVVLHESLPAEEWEQWMSLRRKRRWPIDALTLGKQLEILKPCDTATQRQIINASINAGWQGLFPPKHTNGSTRKPQQDAPTTAELEAREAARAGG